ncbi:MAG: YceH family protein [Daejeonella sp.]|uniref:YceH family protein n=1 Tax=Daejeonella sp. TaxID=2805397 RepID=UPI0027324B84|nr:YceH family protein [Daejeonella sp.]MDP3466714.1 YceH family protein [Daejeonella sp.]
MDLNQNIAQLSAEEQRVLGSLIEKSKTTPDYYPMSINGLQSACNQKTSRSPIVQYDEETIVETLNSLKKKSLVSTATGGSSRVVKYKHNLGIVYPLIPAELALLGLLLLRGPQTPGELNTNSGRLYEFETIEEVQSTLQDLSKRGFVKSLDRRPGQKEVRFVHLLGDSVNDSYDYQSGINPASSEQLSARVEILEKELSELKEAFNKLLSELN